MPEKKETESKLADSARKNLGDRDQTLETFNLLDSTEDKIHTIEVQLAAEATALRRALTEYDTQNGNEFGDTKKFEASKENLKKANDAYENKKKKLLEKAEKDGLYDIKTIEAPQSQTLDAGLADIQKTIKALQSTGPNIASLTENIEDLKEMASDFNKGEIPKKSRVRKFLDAAGAFFNTIGQGIADGWNATFGRLGKLVKDRLTKKEEETGATFPELSTDIQHDEQELPETETTTKLAAELAATEKKFSKQASAPEQPNAATEPPKKSSKIQQAPKGGPKATLKDLVAGTREFGEKAASLNAPDPSSNKKKSRPGK